MRIYNSKKENEDLSFSCVQDSGLGQLAPLSIWQVWSCSGRAGEESEVQKQELRGDKQSEMSSAVWQSIGWRNAAEIETKRGILLLEK